MKEQFSEVMQSHNKIPQKGTKETSERHTYSALLIKKISVHLAGQNWGKMRRGRTRNNDTLSKVCP